MPDLPWTTPSHAASTVGSGRSDGPQTCHLDLVHDTTFSNWSMTKFTTVSTAKTVRHLGELVVGQLVVGE
jgi:hypothetical protein